MYGENDGPLCDLLPLLVCWALHVSSGCQPEGAHECQVQYGYNESCRRKSKKRFCIHYFYTIYIKSVSLMYKYNGTNLVFHKVCWTFRISASEQNLELWQPFFPSVFWFLFVQNGLEFWGVSCPRIQNFNVLFTEPSWLLLPCDIVLNLDEKSSRSSSDCSWIIGRRCSKRMF